MLLIPLCANALARLGKTALQQWRCTVFSAQVQRSVQEQGLAVHAGDPPCYSLVNIYPLLTPDPAAGLCR